MMTAPRIDDEDGSPSQGNYALPAEPGDTGFDRWLRRELSRLYDAALDEPLPEEMLRLLSGDSEH